MQHAPLPQDLADSYRRSKQFGVRPDYVENEILSGRELHHRRKHCNH